MGTKDIKEEVGEVKDLEDLEDPEDLDEIEDPDEEDLDDDALDEDLEDVEVLKADIDIEDDEIDDDDADDDETGNQDEETTEALEELESQELQLLDEEKNDNLLVDEVEVLRAIRREELTMNVDTQLQRDDEFVCQSCFMVKRTSQLANRRKMFCADCAY